MANTLTKKNSIVTVKYRRPSLGTNTIQILWHLVVVLSHVSRNSYSNRVDVREFAVDKIN